MKIRAGFGTLLFLLSYSLFGQLSPGPLAEKHAHLEGLAKCVSCHKVGSGDFSSKCLDCHRLLGKSLEAGSGLHGSQQYTDCRSCHSDHQGRGFAMIHWPEGEEAFDHTLTGHELEGAHQKLECRTCHQAELIQKPQRLTEAGKQTTHTFMGLGTQCINCHEDIHGEQLADQCSDCHNQSDWLKVDRFDHQQTSFPLRAAHAALSCDQCHPIQAEERRLFKPIAHDRCSDCHSDVHLGRLGDACEDCHNQKSFEIPTFDHSRTGYVLSGKHLQVACAACHPSEAGTVRYRPIAADLCSDCHTDPHRQRLGPDCGSCHQTQGWAARTKTPFDHEKTRFPLLGRHRKTTCDACHGERGLHIDNHQDCQSCHEDIHEGRLSHYRDQGNCAACHDEQGFVPARFSSQDHRQGRFPLTGAHLATPCFACHAAEEPGQPVPFHFQDLACTGCHEDIHRGEADPFMPDGSCEACHTTERWQALRFDHGKTDFPLAFKHRDQACAACHTSASGKVVLTGLPTECARCHEDRHQGQFAERSCRACHTAQHWQADLFDHSQSRFVLDGAHQQVPCASCHPTVTTQPAPLVQYRPLPSACADCHHK